MSDDDLDEGIDVDDPKRPCPANTTAVILAGGKGGRMRPYEGPKTLVPIAGKQLLRRLIVGLEAQGIHRFHICVGHKAEEVMHAAKGFAKDSVEFSNAGEHATIAQRLAEAVTRVQTPYVLVCYGDTLADVDVASMCQLLAQSEAGLVFAAYPLASEFGIVESLRKTIDGRPVQVLDRIREKPVLDLWFNIGFMLCHHWATLQLNPAWDSTAWVNALAKDDLVLVHRHPGWHFTVNTEQDLAAVNERFRDIARRIDG